MQEETGGIEGDLPENQAGAGDMTPEPAGGVPLPEGEVPERAAQEGPAGQTEQNEEVKKIEESKDQLKFPEEELETEEEQEIVRRRANMNLDDETALLEAVLFLESEPQDVETLARITRFSEDVVSECIERLKEKYESPDSGIEVSMVLGGWLLTPKKACFDLVKERYGKKNEGRLSRSAIETLSIIAYSQPITRAEIESIRHVNVDAMMRLLLDRKFITEKGHKDIPGKPTMYGTTDEFLNFFHLQSIKDLPQLDEKESERFELAR